MKLSRMRISAAAALIAVVEAFMLVTDMGPNVPLVAVVIGVVAVLGWTAADLAEGTEVVGFPTSRAETSAPASVDRAIGSLRFLVSARRDADAAERLRTALVDLVDQRLRSRYGIDRRTDPASAAAVLPSELRHLVDEGSGAVDVGKVSEIDRLLRSVELM